MSGGPVPLCLHMPCFAQTYTMAGPHNNPGINRRALSRLFELVAVCSPAVCQRLPDTIGL